MSNPYQQAYASGSNSPMATPTPIKRGRGRPPKNRNLNPQQGQLAPPQPTSQPRLSQITSPRLRTVPTTFHQFAPFSAPSGSPFQPPSHAFAQAGVGPGTPDQNVMYQPLPTMFGRPHYAALPSAPTVPSFPPMPSFQRQQQLQQQQSQTAVRQAQQARQTNGHHPTSEEVPPLSSSSSIPEGAIMTPAGGSIGAGLGQAVGNAGASPASRTRRKADMTEPDLKVPDANDQGWMNAPKDASAAQQAYSTIVDYIRNYTDASGRRLSLPLEDCPDPEMDPDYYVKVEKPTSLSAIQTRITEAEYATPIEFEMDMLQLFENGRRLYSIGTQLYGDVIVLQRLYHHLTRSRPSSGKPTTAEAVLAAADTADSSRNFSSIPFGPGYASAGSDGDLTTRISSKMKTYYEHLNFKGKAFRVGDWVHLINPSDPTKPIVGQIFKVMRREDDDPDQGWVTVCWYFRPEQTFHPPSKKFFKDEVVKTGYFADHQIEDIIEKTMVMFYTKYIRGRPKADYWDPKSPLYVTESRYNEQQRVFHKIKSWASCVPEEIRKVETPMHFFEKAIAPPPREESPFLRGVQGPGALRDEDLASGDVPEFPDLFRDAADDTRSKRKSRDGEDNSAVSQHPRSAGETFTSLASQVAARITPEQYFRLQQLLSNPQAVNLDMVQLSSELGGLDVNLLSELRNAAVAAGVSNAGIAKVASPNFAANASVTQAQAQSNSSGAAGQEQEGSHAAGTGIVDLVTAQKGEGYYAELPAETQDLFADPADGQVTWYPAPPLDGPVQHQLYKNGFFHPQLAHFRHHSLDYLYHLSTRADATLPVRSESHDGVHRVQAESQPSQPSTLANGSSTPRAMLSGPSPYVQHASGMYDFLAPSARNSPSLRPGMQGSAAGFPAASSNGSADEALTPVMNQNNGWYGSEWGDDPQKTAEALADFSNQYGDGNQYNFSHFLS